MEDILSFRQDIFRYVGEDEELVVEPFRRLIGEKKLLGYRYDKFWHCMDTFKEQQELNDMYESGQAPWEVWKKCKDKKTGEMVGGRSAGL